MRAEAPLQKIAPGQTPAGPVAALPPSAPAPDDPATQAAFHWDDLAEGLTSGRFGGVPLPGVATAALLHSLAALGWAKDPRALSEALPHFPAQITADDICGTLVRLGYNARIVTRPGHLLARLPRGTVALSGNRYLAVDATGSAVVLRDLADGSEHRCARRRSYRCLVAEPAAAAAAPLLPTLRRIQVRFRPELSMLLVLSLVSSGLVVLTSLSVAFILNTVLPAEAPDTLVAVMAGIGLLVAIDLGIRTIRARLVARIAARIEYILGTELYEKLVHLPLPMLTGSTVSDQLSRMRQFETARDFFCGPVVSVLFDLPFAAILLLAFFVASPPIGLLMTGVIALYALIGLVTLPKVRAGVALLASRRSAYARRLSATLSARAHIVQRGLGAIAGRSLAQALRDETDARRDLDRTLSTLSHLSTVLVALAIAGVAMTGAWLAMGGALSTGGLIACMILASRLLAPVQQTLLVAVRAFEITAVFRQIDLMMQLPTGASGARALSDGATGAAPDAGGHAAGRGPELRFETVTLSYPGSTIPALRGIDLAIPHGTLVGVGGPSGSGKTSLLRAIVGNHPLRGGVVRHGDRNLVQLSGRDRSARVGFVGSEQLMIHGTVAQNLRLGIPGSSLDQLRSVCDELGILHLIERLPMAFDTKLPPPGSDWLTAALQVQLSIARQLLAAPQILLFDEAISLLSPDCEERVFAAIDRRRDRMTFVMITHRPSALRRSDRVILLDAGRVAFDGPPSKLPSERSS